MNIFITGINGYIGQSLLKIATLRGHNVIGASRTLSKNVFHWVKFDLQSSDPIIIPESIDTVVHLAADTSNRVSDENDFEVQRAITLLNGAKHIKFLFISSQSADVNAPTAYGRIKWKIEQEVLARNGYVIRPGLVYGGERKGLYGQLVKLTKKLPLLPAFIPAPTAQPIHVDDLAEGIMRVIETDRNIPHLLCLASPNKISFNKFLSQISIYQNRSFRPFFPAPVFLIKWICMIIGKEWASSLGLTRLSSLFNAKFLLLQFHNFSIRAIIEICLHSNKFELKYIF